jgi:hypothetical protein
MMESHAFIDVVADGNPVFLLSMDAHEAYLAGRSANCGLISLSTALHTEAHLLKAKKTWREVASE